MRILFVFVLFLILFVACTRSPVLSPDRFNVSSMLNDSIWFATGEAVEQTDTLAKPCILHRLDLFIKTDIPYPGFPGEGIIQDSITGCIGECRPSQWLTIFNIPIKKGKYRIAELNRCGQPFSDYQYFWSGYSGGLVKPFFLDDQKAGWVRVRHYNPETRVIEGRFKGDFSDTTGRVAQFRRGTFKVALQFRKKMAGD